LHRKSEASSDYRSVPLSQQRKAFVFVALLVDRRAMSNHQQSDSKGRVDEFVISGCARGQESKIFLHVLIGATLPWSSVMARHTVAGWQLEIQLITQRRTLLADVNSSFTNYSPSL
jgi:hypothetical protein